MAPRLTAIALSILGVCAITACGSTTHVTRTITRAAPSPAASSTATSTASATSTAASTPATTATSTATSASASTLAGRSPRQIVDLAARALQHATGYAMRADLTQDHQHTVIALTTTGPRTFNASIDTGRQDTSIVRIGSASYLRGNRGFWVAQAGRSTAARARAATLAGRWIRVPASNRSSVDGSLGTLGPQTLARCLREDHGHLTVTGHTTIDHRPAIVIRDAGDAPGATPGTIAIAATGTPYPLRYTATGYARRGGPVDVCNTGKGGGAEGTISIDQFGAIPQIQAPTGAASDPDAPSA